MGNIINKSDAGFRLNNLLLMECTLKRVAQVTFDEVQVKSSANIDVDVQKQDSILMVTETLDYSQKLENTEQVTVKIVMVGVFEIVGSPVIEADEFGRVNGAAIIFPYIREHLTSLSVKAGLGVILLPPANFTVRK